MKALLQQMSEHLQFRDFNSLGLVVERFADEYFTSSGPQFDDHDVAALGEEFVDTVGFLGVGANALTLINPCDPSRIYKVVINRVDPAPRFARFAMENPDNPMLPRVYGVYELPCKFNLIEMERLSRHDGVGVSGAYEAVKIISRRYGGEPYHSVRDNLDKIINTRIDISMNTNYNYHISDFRRIIWWLANIFDEDKARPDMHGENWMLRGNQLVITDPISSAEYE